MVTDFRDAVFMEPTSLTPEPTGRPSSVTRKAAPTSEIAGALPPVDTADDQPTIISMNRPRASSAEVADGLRGKKLAHFELIEPIGVGGMAAVIRANDLQLGRVVALKILPPEMAADPENIGRFKQEARAAAKLDHENVARVYFCGEDQGLHFIAFEYVEGTDLRSIMSRGGPLAPAVAVKHMLQVAVGLAHASSRGVTHRDIKPSNIIITPEGRAKIVDMGLARSADGGVTQSGVTLGTFDYISPEQAIEPRNADVRSDIYSLGCTFYHLLTGQPPVPEGTAAKKLHHHQHVPPVDPRELNPDIPDELVAVLGKMMAKEPRDRYQRPEQLIQHLLAIANKMQLPADSSSQETMLFVDAPLPQPPRFSPVLAAVAGVAAVAILAVILGMGGDEPRSLPVAASPRNGKEGSTTTPQGPVASPSENVAPVDRGPKAAANEQELARLLETADNIELTADEYDLNSLPRPLTTKSGVKIVGKTRSGKRPELRWKADANAGDAVQALLNVAAGTPVRLENLKFVVQSTGEVPGYAIAAAGPRRLTLVDCEFTPDAKSGQAGGIRFEAPAADSADIDLLKCHFAQGASAVDVIGRAAVHAKDCTFGQHDIVFNFREKGIPATPQPDRLLAELDHCTVIMKDGTIFETDRNVSGTIRAGGCLFGRAGERGEVVVVHANGSRDRDSSSPIHFAGSEKERNVYYGVICWATSTRQTATPEECKNLGLPFADAGVFLANGPPPWQTAQPLELLAKPKEAFALKTDRPELRTRSNKMVGAFSEQYGPLPPLPEAPAEATNVAVVAPDDASGRYFKTFAAAIQGRTGDLTVLIRHNGPFKVEPVLLAERNLKLSVKPDEGFRPQLTLKSDEYPAMFSVNNASLSFKDMRFLLQPDKDDDGKWVSVVTVSGTGQVTFEDCVATLNNLARDDETQPVLVALTGDASPAGDKLPRVRLANCFVRGRGHVVAVRNSRPFELEAENVLAVLRGGSFVSIAGQSKEPPLGSHSQLGFKRVTAYLTDAFLDMRAPEGDRKVAGLVPTQVKCEECLLVAAQDKPAVYAERIDRDTLVKSSLLTWEGSKNVYGNFQKYLEAKPGGTIMIMQTDWTASEWRNFSHDGEDSTATVNFTRTPPKDEDYPTALPRHFRPKLSDMRRTPEMMMTKVGADVDALQKLVE